MSQSDEPKTGHPPKHGVPPGVAHEDATGLPTSDRHKTEHALLTDEERDPAAKPGG